MDCVQSIQVRSQRIFIAEYQYSEEPSPIWKHFRTTMKTKQVNHTTWIFTYFNCICNNALRWWLRTMSEKFLVRTQFQTTFTTWILKQKQWLRINQKDRYKKRDKINWNTYWNQINETFKSCQRAKLMETISPHIPPFILCTQANWSALQKKW